MNSRRKFISQAGLAVAGVALLPYIGCLASENRKEFGIQLYSLRDEFKTGVEKVISEVAKAGYSYVEAYGYSVEKGFWGLSSKEFKALLDKNNLTCPSGHYDFGAWEESQDDTILQSYIDTAKILDQKYIVVPYINPEIYKDEERCKAFVEKLNRAGKIIKGAGLKLAYHNHDIEFYSLGNKTGYDILLQNTDPDLIDFELDLYWVVRAKQDPIKLINTYPGRFTMWHIKDMSKTNPSKNTEIGNGSINYKEIYKNTEVSGLKYPFVEQENFDIDPYQSINKSSDYIKSMI